VSWFDDRERNSNIPSCPDLTPEQLLDNLDGEGDAWFVDQWGIPHPLRSGRTIGRDRESCSFVILHPSVSSSHARLERRVDDTWQLLDHGSLNGTQVNGKSVRRTLLCDGDIVRFGDVSLRFSERAPATAKPDEPGGPGRTRRSNARDLPIQIALHRGDRALKMLRRAEGGEVASDSEKVRLAALEYSLLRALVERHIATANAGSGGDPFMTARELASKLAFRSHDADSDNVRELVRRVRQKLGRLDASDIIASERGSGYRLGWTIAGLDRPEATEHAQPLDQVG
jgi:hypothetical protein